MADSVTEISGWDLDQFPVKNCSFCKLSVPQFMVTDRGKNTDWPNHEDFIQLLWHVHCSAEPFAKNITALSTNIATTKVKKKSHTEEKKNQTPKEAWPPNTIYSHGRRRKKGQPDTEVPKTHRHTDFTSSKFTIKIRKMNENVLSCYKKAKPYAGNITILIPIYWPHCFKNNYTNLNVILSSIKQQLRR